MGGSIMGNAGRVLMIPKGDYNPATPYEMLDCVYYNGRSYVCKQASTGHAPTNTTYWQALTGDASAEIQALTNEVKGNWSEGGKNLFKVTASSQTLGSIVFTVNADGTLSAVGASGDSYRQLNLGTITGIGGAVKLVGCPSGGVIGQTYVVSMKNETTNTWLSPADTGDGQQYTLVENNTYSVNIVIYQNQTVNLLFKPMVSKDLSVTYADYQPYAKTNVELTQLGVYYNTSNDSISLPTGTEPEIINISNLPAGVYIVSAMVRGYPNTECDKYARVLSSNDSNIARIQGVSKIEDISISAVVNIPVNNGTISIKAYQNSGSTVTLNARLDIVRVG